LVGAIWGASCSKQTTVGTRPHLQYFEHGSSTCTLAEVWHPLQSFLMLLFMLLVVLLLLNLCSLPYPLYLPAVPAAIYIIHFKMTLNPQAEYTARHHKSVTSSSSFNQSHIHQYPSKLRISCKESPQPHVNPTVSAHSPVSSECEIYPHHASRGRRFILDPIPGTIVLAAPGK
jgi:hypothetical protein